MKRVSQQLFHYPPTRKNNTLAQGHDVIKLIDEMEVSYSFIGNDGSLFYFLTDLDADNGRVIGIDVTQPEKENWIEIIPESEQSIAVPVIDMLRYHKFTAGR